MPLPIQTARHAHAVRSPEQLETKQRRHLRKVAEASGDQPVEPWETAAPLVARVNHGLWLGDCPCGNGVAIEPTWSIGRCFECGAVFRTIVMPPDAEDGAHILAHRARKHQHWTDERLLDLAIENVQHGDRF